MSLKVFLHGWYGRRNLGDEILYEENLRFLHEVWPSAEFLLLSPLRPTVDGNCHRVHWYPLKKRFALSPLWDHLKMAYRSDVYVSCGGSFLSDDCGERKLALMVRFLIVLAARLGGAKQVFLSIGFGPIKTKLGRVLSRHILSRAIVIECRDRESYDEIKRFNLDCLLLHSADPALGLVNRSWGESGTRSIVLLNFSGSARRDGFRDYRLDLDIKIARELSEWAAESDYDLYLIAVGPGDADRLELVKRNIPELPPVVHISSVEDAHQWIGKAVLLVAERLHALIVSFVFGTKFVGLPHHIKIMQFQQQVSGVGYLHMSNKESIRETLKAIDWAKSCSGGSILGEPVNRLRKCRSKMLELLRSLD